MSFDEFKDLLHATKTADRGRGMNDLLSLYMDFVRRRARVQLGTLRESLLESSDVSQEVFLSIAHDIRSGRILLHSEDEFLALLRKRTRWAVMDQQRRLLRQKRDRRREQSLAGESESNGEVPDRQCGDPLTDMIDAESQESWQSLRARLPEILSDVELYLFSEKFEKGRDTVELAERFDCSTGAMRMRINRVVAKIRSAFGTGDFLVLDE